MNNSLATWPQPVRGDLFKNHRSTIEPKCSWNSKSDDACTHVSLLTLFLQQPPCWQKEAAHFLHTCTCIFAMLFSGALLLYGVILVTCGVSGTPGLKGERRLLKGNAAQCGCKGLTGALCAGASVFQGGSGGGWRKCGTKFLVDINLLPLGGPRKPGRSGGEGRPVDITPQQSRSVWMDGTNGLHPWERLHWKTLPVSPFYGLSYLREKMAGKQKWWSSSVHVKGQQSHRREHITVLKKRYRAACDIQETGVNILILKANAG